MRIGAVLPHNEIGTDPQAIKAYLQGLEAQGLTHLLIYDHVLGADPDRPIFVGERHSPVYAMRRSAFTVPARNFDRARGPGQVLLLADHRPLVPLPAKPRPAHCMRAMYFVL